MVRRLERERGMEGGRVKGRKREGKPNDVLLSDLEKAPALHSKTVFGYCIVLPSLLLALKVRRGGGVFDPSLRGVIKQYTSIY